MPRVDRRYRGHRTMRPIRTNTWVYAGSFPSTVAHGATSGGHVGIVDIKRGLTALTPIFAAGSYPLG